METKIDIAAILKDKPKNTKLYSPLFGYVYFLGVEYGIIKVTHCGKLVIFFGDGRYYNYPESEPLLFPSKEMRDWSKFAWERGDALINDAGYKIFFDKWENDNYTRFFGSVKVHCYDTEDYTLASKEEAQEFIKSIEKTYGGKLNLKTLEIEKQPEFHDGDVLFVKCKGSAFIEIFNYSKNNGDLYDHASLDTTTHELDISGEYKIFKENIMEIRLAAEEEKKQLFSALEKKGKAWDAEKKQIVDLKPKVELKPFDKVVVRCGEADKWSIDFFSYKVSNGYICTGDAWFGYCLPYNEETAKLIGTTNNWKGGEK